MNLNSSISGKHKINTSAGKFKVTNVEMVFIIIILMPRYECVVRGAGQCWHGRTINMSGAVSSHVPSPCSLQFFFSMNDDSANNINTCLFSIQNLAKNAYYAQILDEMKSCNIRKPPFEALTLV